MARVATSKSAGAGRRPLASWPPAFIWLPSVVVAGAMLLPLAYLVLRAAGASSEVWDLLFRSRTLEILLRSVYLVAAVTAGCIAIALPLAWLTVRTDLPFRRLWMALTSLRRSWPDVLRHDIALANSCALLWAHMGKAMGILYKKALALLNLSDVSRETGRGYRTGPRP